MGMNIVPERSIPLTTTIELMKKVCLIGDSGVGKTSLIRRFVLDLFDDAYITTIGAKVTKKTLAVDLPERDLHIKLILMIWDIVGQKHYKLFHEMYLKGMEGVLAVADITRRDIFDNLKDAIQMADRTVKDIPMIFLINKCDLAEPISIDLKDMKTLASQRGMPVMMASARTGMNVELAFNQLGRMVVDVWLNNKDKQRTLNDL